MESVSSVLKSLLKPPHYCLSNWNGEGKGGEHRVWKTRRPHRSRLQKRTRSIGSPGFAKDKALPIIFGELTVAVWIPETTEQGVSICAASCKVRDGVCSPILRGPWRARFAFPCAAFP